MKSKMLATIIDARQHELMARHAQPAPTLMTPTSVRMFG